ncbi:MAG: hypothetical protein QOK11_3241 [Pseudonocardiales bacterium]|nr:hypothetical protein [Pseudonocardiales bacterium]
MRRGCVLIGIAALGVPVLAAGLVWFQPWKLWVDHRVDEQLPEVALVAPATPGSTTPPRTTPGSTTPPRTTPAASATASSTSPRLVSRGELISHEHATHGTVSVVLQPDGRRVLAIAKLDTSNGPDLHVWLTDAKVGTGSNSWHVFDDGEHVSLGRLKGNLGNQVYAIPAAADLARLTSVTIWCDRFDVSFGAAELTPVQDR